MFKSVVVLPKVEIDPTPPADPGVVITEEMSENYESPMNLDDLVS